MNRSINKAHKMTKAVTALVVAMTVLVVGVVIWVCVDSYANIQYHEAVSTKLDSIQSVALDMQDILKESSDSLKIKAFEEILEAKIDAVIIEENSSAIDSNNYMALILTLVTLCVSLSAVIPYIVGKSISKFEIKNVVEDLYAKDKHDVSVKYRESVNMLLASEAHLSRMTAYELLSISQLQDQLQKLQALQESPAPQESPALPTDSPFDLSIHPAWALGWASKALFRYVVIGNPDYKRFCDELRNYIKIRRNLTSDSIVVERAFYDLFNALTYNTILNNGMLHDLDDDLKECLKELAVYLPKPDHVTTTENASITVDSIVAKAKEKSHIDQYLDSDYLKGRYETSAKYLASEIMKYLASPPQDGGKEGHQSDGNNDKITE